MITKVLVMENTEGIADILSFSRTADYDVTSASDGREAMKILSEKRFNIVISDVKVPDMDSIEFLCHIKKHHPGTEVIMVSDMENKDIGIQSLKYEASDYLFKPVTGESLEIVLERAKRKISILKKLSPSARKTEKAIPDNSEKISMAKQMLKILSSSKPEGKSFISGLISIHSPEGIIIDLSEEYIRKIGNIKGRNSWEIYTGESGSKEACPVISALTTMEPCVRKAVIRSGDGKKHNVNVFAAPVVSTGDEPDFILEVINL